MGYLDLQRLNTLELFLTDKGKELMMRENGLGFADLCVQFSLDDPDYDYRRTSYVWVDGISPNPPGPGGWYPNPYGSTETHSNHSSGPQWFEELSNNNPCRSCDGCSTPLSGDCWYDMPDVRGSRGRTIVSCHPVTGTTTGLTNCTNIYAFYDATSVYLQDAQAAKVGLTHWFSGVTASTITTANPHGSYTGKLFHIPVFGERWLNTAYYPWHGELDTVDYNGQGNSLNSLALAPRTQPLDPNGGLYDGTGVYASAGVTGLYLHVDNSQNTGNWSGFQVLPPGAFGETGNFGQGSRAEFFATGCTQNSDDCFFNTGIIHQLPYGVNHPIPCETEVWHTETLPNILYSANSTTTVYKMKDGSWGTGMETWTTQPYINKYGWWDYHTNLLADFSIYVNETVRYNTITGLTNHEQYNLPENVGPLIWESDVGSGCKLNCCNTRENSGTFNYQLSGGTGGPLGTVVTGGTRMESESFSKDDDSLENTGSQFGCMECNPFDNFVPYETGHTYSIQGALGLMEAFEEPDGTVTSVTGNCGVRIWYLSGPCKKYKGGDKNVMVVSIVDEVSSMTCNATSWGGVLPLDYKNVYNGNGISDYTLNNDFDQFSPGASMPLSRQKRRGYHAKGVYTPSPSTCPDPMNGPGCTGNAGYRGPYGCDGTAADNYPTQCEIVSGVHQNDWSAGGHPQPTMDFKFAQDLFMRTLPFYNSFIGFLYPVVKNLANARAEFALHAYGAIVGTTVDPADLIENQTVESQGGTFSAITKSNPYSQINPIVYNRPTVPFSPTSSPAWYSGQQLYPNSFVPPFHVTHGVQPSALGAPGLGNYNWGVNLSVGCSVNAPSAVGCSSCNICCSSGDIFSGGTFNNDLTEFIKGGAFKIITTTTGCTECQCLPAVFRSNTGPPIVIEDEGCPCPGGGFDPICCIGPSGCPCGDGSYSPSCCPDPEGPGESICGPAASISGGQGETPSTGGGQPSGGIGEGLTPNGGFRTTSNMSAPVSNASFRENLNIQNNVNFNVNLHQFVYMENGEQKIDYDIEFASTSTANGQIIKENEALFYWKIDNGIISYDPKGNPTTQPCTSLEWAALNQRYTARGAYPFVFLNSYRNGDPAYWKYNKEEYCITLGVHKDNQVMMVTKRIRITGDNTFGWQLKMLT